MDTDIGRPDGAPRNDRRRRRALSARWAGRYRNWPARSSGRGPDAAPRVRLTAEPGTTGTSTSLSG